MAESKRLVADSEPMMYIPSLRGERRNHWLMPERARQSEHTVTGESVGDFAEFASHCRMGPGTTVPRSSFRSVKYVNHSDDRSLPLYRCSVRDADIRGMYLVQDFRDSDFTNVDFAHGAGYAVWLDASFKGCNFRSFRAQITAVGVTFYRCHFGSAHLQHAILLNCRFEKCTMSGVWSASSFLNCSFEDVDLAGSVWREPAAMQISGSWRNENKADGFHPSAT
jgi:hypothetical protein